MGDFLKQAYDEMTELKSIWHKLPEQPENGRDVIEKWHHLGIHYTHFVAKNGIAEDNPFTDAWCYLDDLLALETDLDRTKKQLEIAVDALKEIGFGKNINIIPDDESAKYINLSVEALDKIQELEQKDK